MKIEMLFSEICNLYGEPFNMEYIRRTYPQAKIIHTSLREKPRFLEEEIDLVYMGTMTENNQILAIEALRTYKEGIYNAIENGQYFLITGNALEIFGKGISDKEGSYIQGLGIFDFTSERDMMSRFNSLYVGEFYNENEIFQVAGFKSQFGHSSYGSGFMQKNCLEETGDSEGRLLYISMFETLRGPGFNTEVSSEGIRCRNFMGTYVIGPLLILNPWLTKLIIEKITGEQVKPAYEKAAVDAYKTRISEYMNPETGIYY